MTTVFTLGLILGCAILVLGVTGLVQLEAAWNKAAQTTVSGLAYLGLALVLLGLGYFDGLAQFIIAGLGTAALVAAVLGGMINFLTSQRAGLEYSDEANGLSEMSHAVPAEDILNLPLVYRGRLNRSSTSLTELYANSATAMAQLTRTS